MGLIERVSAYFQHTASLATDGRGDPADIELQVSTAILLLEAACGDAEYDWSEHRAIVKGLERIFGIEKKKVLRLLERAHAIRPPVVSLEDVTDIIKSRYNKQQCADLMELVWRVIDADAVVEEWEESFGDHVAAAVGLNPEETRLARNRIEGRTDDGRHH